MIAANPALNGLKRRRPEWEPWLAVVEEVLREADAPAWDAAVPVDPARQEHGVPVLARTTITVPAKSVRRLLERMVRSGSRRGTTTLATVKRALDADHDVLTLFTASLSQDTGRINDIAAACGADAEAMQAVVALLPVPFLQACNRRWAGSVPESWMEGYCPVCGSWPAFAEVRGIERSRHLRCSRCGGAWHAHPLRCPYCSACDHNDLVALVPQRDRSHAVIDACRRCYGYVKTLTMLQGCPAAAVMLGDLASVDLDLAALEQGYARPQGAGYKGVAAHFLGQERKWAPTPFCGPPRFAERCSRRSTRRKAEDGNASGTRPPTRSGSR